jgi:hypothetical protein
MTNIHIGQSTLDGHYTKSYTIAFYYLFSMIESRLYESPNEIQSNILCYFFIQSIMRLYQTSHYWRRRISNDKLLWRNIYERNFGHEFAEDRWILWAICRLWSQSSSEEKRLAARRVSLTTLAHLDGHTWYCLVRGRILTMKNWRNNTPQRVIILPENYSDMHIYAPSSVRDNFSYGIPFISDGHDRLGFGIIDDTLNGAQLASIPDTLVKALPSQAHDNNIVFRRITLAYSTQHTIDLFDHVTNDEFVVARRKLNKQDYSIPMVMLVWNIGHLEVHTIEHQSYCIPSLCMAELLPHRWWHFIEQKSGWLLIEGMNDDMDKSTR